MGKALGTMEKPMQEKKATKPAPVRALVVDDGADVALTLSLLLKRLGYDVQAAYNAEEAFQKASALRPDVVFLDIGLPDLSGYDVCKEMRQSDWGARSFIVAVTGRDEPSDLLRAANSGFDRHVGKPMLFGTLKEILRTVATRTALSQNDQLGNAMA